MLQFLGSLDVLKLLLGLLVILLKLLQLLVFGLDHFLQVEDVPLLIAAMLGIIWRPHEELQSNGVIFVVQIAFSVQQVNTVKAIVAPAFTNFEFGGKFSNYLRAGISVIYHFDSVFVLLSLGLW